MLRIILLSLLWAVCSTCLVTPQFWQTVRNNMKKNVSGCQEVKISKVFIVLEISIFVILFIMSIQFYVVLGNRQNLYGSFCMIIFCVIIHLINEKNKRIMLIIAAIIVILWAEDSIASSNISVSLDKVDYIPIASTQTDQDSEVKFSMSVSEIQSLFKANLVSGPTYNNGKYIFTVGGGSNGKGVVFIDRDNCSGAYFLPCSSGFEVKELRSQYPTQNLKPLYVTISDENVPYGLFAVANKSWILGSYNVEGYVMLNLVTGEMQYYAQEELLPSFVMEN